jgi:ankyrin repeat protein
MQLLVNVGGADLSSRALMWAAIFNLIEAITYLMGSYKDPLSHLNSLGEFNQPILHYAIRDGRCQELTVRHLLDLGADAAFKGPSGWNAAHYACVLPNVSLNVLKVLIHSAGGSIDDQVLDGNTYLHIASEADKSE